MRNSVDMARRSTKVPTSPPKIEIRKPDDVKLWQKPGFNLLLFALFLLGSSYVFQSWDQEQREAIPYSQFLQDLDAGKVKEAVVTDSSITGTLTETDPETKQPRRFTTVPLWHADLAQKLEQKGVDYSVAASSNWLSSFIFNWVLPFGLLFLLWGWMARRMRAGAGGFLNIGNRVHIHPEGGVQVTFDDVAGAEEEKRELKESIEFLKDPSRIQHLGGHMPKGMLLVGAPGTGKTLLARAVAGEAGVPFFNISGSEFIEMFVGIGAARVRDLFQQARQKAPCIIFIDELDAIGGARGIGPVMGGHDEREQTLNQLLTEMDGFDPSVGVVVMAATNRPEILDKALLRAGRFDRQIVVDRPDLEARVAILQLHARQIKLAADVDLDVVARRTPGFVGADLANIANEAAILAVRANHDAVTMADFEAAIDRVVAGPEKRHRVLDEPEKRRVAYHESGHSIVAKTVPTGEPVHKISIIPRGVAALGYTQQLPAREKFLHTKTELEDQLAILLGGRTAEELVFGDVSSGAQDDLEHASEIARSMVAQLGMSEKLGPLAFGKHRQLRYLGVEAPGERDYSEATARVIDAEVRALIDSAHLRAREILSGKRHVLDALATMLQNKEVVSGSELDALLRTTPKAAVAEAVK